MPELPEIETFRRQLEREVVAKRVKSATVEEMGAIVRHPNKSHFTGKLEGAKLSSLKRRGTYLLFGLDTGDVLVVDLGPSGRLLKAGAREQAPEGTRVEMSFTQGGVLRFVDPDGNGQMFVTDAESLADELPQIAAFGLDPIEAPITWTDFAHLVLGRKMKLKALLTDPSLLAGIGPVYSDEILYESGLRHDRSSDSLSIQEVRRLARSVVEVLHDAVKYGGSTLADDRYRDLHGDPGTYQEHHRVYERTGDPCIRCRDTVKKGKFAGTVIYFCEQCQT